MKVCWAKDEAAARKTAFELWPNTLVPGQLSQELALPSHFEQASELVTEDKLAEVIACGPDQAGFFDFYRRELAPRLS
jgi:hypothetical protein